MYLLATVHVYVRLQRSLPQSCFCLGLRVNPCTMCMSFLLEAALQRWLYHQIFDESPFPLLRFYQAVNLRDSRPLTITYFCCAAYCPRNNCDIIVILRQFFDTKSRELAVQAFWSLHLKVLHVLCSCCERCYPKFRLAFGPQTKQAICRH